LGKINHWLLELSTVIYCLITAAVEKQLVVKSACQLGPPQKIVFISRWPNTVQVRLEWLGKLGKETVPHLSASPYSVLSSLRRTQPAHKGELGDSWVKGS
jgi:hypothetical protein